MIVSTPSPEHASYSSLAGLIGFLSLYIATTHMRHDRNPPKADRPPSSKQPAATEVAYERAALDNYLNAAEVSVQPYSEASTGPRAGLDFRL